MPGHEVDRLGRHLRRGHRQVAFVLTALIVDNNHHAPGTDCLDGFVDRRERPPTGTLGDAKSAIFRTHDVSPLRAASSIDRATYLPTISHSRLTRSPARSDDNDVCAHVNGMIITCTILFSSRATVRLTPSIAIDPLRITNGSSSAGIRTAIHHDSPSCRIASTTPTP